MMYVFILALLFILRLKKTPNNVAEFIQSKYGAEVKQKYWKFQNSFKKLRKVELDIEYLQICKAQNIIPKFLRFKLYRKSLKSSSFYQAWQHKLLNHELNSKTKRKVELGSIVKQLKSTFVSSISYLDFIVINRFLQSYISEFSKDVKLTHKRKLHSIGIDCTLEPVNPDKVIFNYSTIQLPDRIRYLLAFGLEFCVPIFKLNYFKYFLSFEKLAYTLQRKESHNFKTFNEQLKSIAFKIFYNFKPL